MAVTAALAAVNDWGLAFRPLERQERQRTDIDEERERERERERKKEENMKKSERTKKPKKCWMLGGRNEGRSLNARFYKLIMTLIFDKKQKSSHYVVFS